MLRPSLYRHYPASLVLWRNPTPRRLFGFLVINLLAILSFEGGRVSQVHTE